MKHKHWKRAVCLSGLLLIFSIALSEVPVTDLTQETDSVTSAAPPDLHANLSPEQRLSRLEQQMSNLITMNLPQQVSDLQQQIDQLRGQVQVEQHDLKILTEQQKNFYQDIDQRISQLKNPNNNVSASTSSVASVPNEGGQLKDSDSYQNAFNLLEAKQFEKAQMSFLNYLKTFPQGQYIANAHYWLGEIYFSQKNNDKAAAEFKIVINQFAQSAKVADAKLKIAIIHQQAGEIAQARTEFLQIKKQHSGSTAAQLANIHLQEINMTHP